MITYGRFARVRYVNLRSRGGVEDHQHRAAICYAEISAMEEFD